MKLLITGGRDFGVDNETEIQIVYDTIIETLIASQLTKDELIPNVHKMVMGDATGVDTVAWQTALVEGVWFQKYKADWDKFGPAAGPIRNKEMIKREHPCTKGQLIDLVLAFPGNIGTAGMVKLARADGIPVKKIDRQGREYRGLY